MRPAKAGRQDTSAFGGGAMLLWVIGGSTGGTCLGPGGKLRCAEGGAADDAEGDVVPVGF